VHLEPIRRALSSQGLTPAAAIPDSSGGRVEEASIRLAALTEGARLQAFPVEPGEPWPWPVAYLDGIQRMELVGYAGSSPILMAEIAAAIRERRERRLRTVMEDRRRIALARPAAVKAAGSALAGVEVVPLPDDDPPHPVRDLLNAAHALDGARGRLELALGDRFRASSETWLVVDGSLSESPRWAADPRMVAISKSHSILPFDGQDLECYLRLPAGHRSSIYAPATRSLAPVRAWGLRLWSWEGKDLLHGLVRVEVAPINGTSDRAATISRWILADRAPVSASDRRWDRMLYGIHSVEQYLKAGAAR
jgi:hypothetical protein